jgi:hypothetical protein
VFSYTGSFEEITSSSGTVKNESDVTKGSHNFTMNSDSLINQQVAKNASGSTIRKSTYAYNANGDIIEQDVYYDGVNLSYTNYYSYDNWGNLIYFKNAEDHEQFLSFANTSTSGFFMDNTGTIIRQFTNAFSNSAVPSSVHTALLGAAEKQDDTYVREVYAAYDSEVHPTQAESIFGNATTYLTFSGTFNEETGDTSFPIDLTGHTVTGNGVLEITGEPSTNTYTETHAYTPDYSSVGCNPTYTKSTWACYGWIASYFKVSWAFCCGTFPDVDCDSGLASIGPFTHRPGTVGYQSYTTIPSCGQEATTFTVKTYWKAYPEEVEYNLDNTAWKTVTSNLSNGTARITCPISDGTHTFF